MSFDLETARAHLAKNDPVLAAIIAKVGPFEPAYRDPTFESLARAIVYQQLHGKAARTIYERLQSACGGKVDPHSILSLSEDQMRACGLSRAKLSYIRDLAAKTLSGEVVFERLPQMSEEEVIEHLIRVKGIGIWSAQMFLMFALRRANILPVSDLGIRSGIQKAYRKRKIPTAKEIIKLSRKWEPYCTLACYYLWRSLDIET
jgi:DNA-3-methyladenine glycosylase II